MEVTCSECGSYSKKIGKEVYYCEDCDRIFTFEESRSPAKNRLLVH